MNNGGLYVICSPPPFRGLGMEKENTAYLMLSDKTSRWHRTEVEAIKDATYHARIYSKIFKCDNVTLIAEYSLGEKVK